MRTEHIWGLLLLGSMAITSGAIAGFYWAYVTVGPLYTILLGIFSYFLLYSLKEKWGEI